LARELKSFNKRILSTTTTQIFQPKDMDYFFLKEIKSNFKPKEGTITFYGHSVKNGKLIGGNIEEINDIIRKDLFDYVIIEADGSKRKPLKAPAEHEPVITRSSTMTIGVIGLDAVGQLINNANFHRAERMAKLIDKQEGDPITTEDITNLILQKNGTFK